jgi:hypothetical protein
MSRARTRRRFHGGAVGWYLLGFAAVQLGLGVVIERAAPALRDEVYAQKSGQLAARCAEAPDRPLLVALGSSRTLLGFDAEYVSRNGELPLAYNFGELGAGTVLEQVFLRRLLAAGVRPDLVLLEVAPLQLADPDSVNARANSHRMSWAELSWVAKYQRRPVNAYAAWAAGRGLACVSSRGALHEALGVDAPRQAGPGAGAYGFLPFSREPEARAAHIRSDLERFAYLAGARLTDGPARSVRDLVGLCRAEGLRFAVVLMPECAGLRALHPPEFLAQLDRLFDDLRRDGEFELIDARAWVADDGFRDCHHLDFTGARAFTARLAADGLPRLRHSADPDPPRLTADTRPFRPPVGAIR